jgi:hypothetical protein
MKYGTIEQEARNCLRRFHRAGTKEGDLVLFFHHGIAIEPLPEPFGVRIEFIQNHKPQEERAIRLHWFRPMPKKMYEALPKEFIAAGQKYSAAGQKYGAAWQKYGAAWQKYGAAWQKYGAAKEKFYAAGEELYAAGQNYDAALKKHAPLINALIKKYYPECPWDGESII